MSAGPHSLLQQLRARDAVLAGVLYGLLALLCTRLPLLHTLGYESSFLFALAGSAVAGLLAIGRIRRVYTERHLSREQAVQGTLRAARSALIANLLLLIIPLMMLLANALFVRNCAILEGAAFFLLLPGVSVCLATALGFFCAVHYSLPRTIFFLFMLASFAYALGLGYFTPAIFSYNFFYGYFPGLTYDEGMRMSAVLVSFRLVTIGLTFFLFWLARLLLFSTERSQTVRQKGIALARALISPSHRGLAAIAVLLAAGLYIFRCDLGYESTASFIRSQLGGRHTTEHFVIYYPLGTYSTEELARVADEHEFRMHQILGLFAMRRTEPVESYIYPSAEAKLRLIGAGNTNIAKPWSRQVHVTLQSLMGTFKHELVHVMAARFGRPVIQASFSMGLTEGLAMAVEWTWGVRTLHQYAAAMQELDLAPDIATLMTPAGFMSQASQVSYVLAGSFCRFLIDRYGMQKLLQVYGSEDYARYYGRPLRILIAEWGEFLSEVELDETDLAASEVFFRQPSIFRKTCPRVVGERNKAAARAMSTGQYAAAESLYAVSYEEGQGYDALNGLVLAGLRRGVYDSVIVRLDRAVRADAYPARYLPLMLQRGDAYWGMGEDSAAFELYHTLRTADLSDAYTEASGARLLAMSDPALRTALRRYFLFAGPDSVRMKVLDSLRASGSSRPLVQYLRGRLALRAGRYADAIALLSACTLEEDDPVLEALRLVSLGMASYQTGAWAEARTWFWLSLNHDDSPAAEYGVNDWIERCEWKMGIDRNTGLEGTTEGMEGAGGTAGENPGALEGAEG